MNFEEDKSQDLKSLLIELSDPQLFKDETVVEKYFNNFQKLYVIPGNSKWRHNYSIIFSTIAFINSNLTQKSIDSLAENIQLLNKKYQEYFKNNQIKEADNISKELEKLKDHVNLDVARLNYTFALLTNINSQIKGLNNFAEDLKIQSKENEKEIDDKINNFSKDLKDSNKEIERENITILGIFASIVLAFTGGLFFSNSVLENINSISIYRLLMIISIIGFVIYNLIWILLEFVRSINGKKISRNCYWWIVNIVLIGLFIFSLLAYSQRWMLFL